MQYSLEVTEIFTSHSSISNHVNSALPFSNIVHGFIHTRRLLSLADTATRVWRILSGDERASLPVMWSEYIAKHVHRTSTRRIAAYGTFRNSAEQYQSWRDNITEDALTKIEEHCQPSLELLGYNVFGDLKTARNLSVSLFAE